MRGRSRGLQLRACGEHVDRARGDQVSLSLSAPTSGQAAVTANDGFLDQHRVLPPRLFIQELEEVCVAS